MSTLRTPKRLFDCFLYTRGPCTKKPLQFTIIYAETPSIVACSFLFEAETLASWSQIFGDNGFRKKWWAKRGTQKKSDSGFRMFWNVFEFPAQIGPENSAQSSMPPGLRSQVDHIALHAALWDLAVPLKISHAWKQWLFALCQAPGVSWYVGNPWHHERSKSENTWKYMCSCKI